MNKIIKICVFLFVGCLFSACSNEDLEDFMSSNEVQSTHRITVEQAQNNAVSFVKNLFRENRANVSVPTVSNVIAIGANKGVSRSNGNSIDLDSLFYIVNFDNQQGFVVAASDDRAPKIFAYVEEGNYEATDTVNPGYGAFMDALVVTEVQRRVNPEYTIDNKIELETNEPTYYFGSAGVPTHRSNKFEVMPPLLTTKWDQYGSYNKYCPNGSVTGCVVTAVAQICSFLETPASIFYKTINGETVCSDLDWSQINKDCSENGGVPFSDGAQDQIAHLMRFWGICFEADYKQNETSVNSHKAISKLQNMGFDATDLEDYNAENVVKELKKGDRIIFMRGNDHYDHVLFVIRQYVDGHAWVVDGYIDSVNDGEESIYLHCNWGWGGIHNGYFLSDVLNAESSPIYNDEGELMSRGCNFRCNLETSTFHKLSNNN